MTCIECKREIGPDEAFVEGMDSFGLTGPQALHDACAERYSDRWLRHQDRVRLVRQLIDEVNAGSSEELADAIVAALTQSHRTLQQAFWLAIKRAIAKYARLDRGTYTDLRNEMAWSWTCRVASGDIDTTGVGFPRY